MSNKYQNLSSKDFKKGAIYALHNAYELHGDAQIMDALGRLPRVYSLMKLALEEVSKSIIFLELSVHKAFRAEGARTIDLYKAIENHNGKTEYALNYLISKEKSSIQALNPEAHNEESFENEELGRLKEMLDRVKELDNKKNTNLYTSLFETQFKPPYLSIEEEDIEDIRHLTFKLLVYAKKNILEIDDTVFESSEIKKEIIEKLDPYYETKQMHLLITKNL